MRQSDISDLLRDRKPRRSAARRTRGQLWLSHLRWLHQLTVAEVDHDIVPNEQDRGSPNGVAYRWEKGDRVPSPGSVMRVERQLPETAWVYDSVLFDLLEAEPLKARRVRDLLAKHWGFSGWKDWLDSGRNSHGYYHPLSLFDGGESEYLLHTCDFDHFIVVVALVRLAEADNDIDRFLKHQSNAYRMYPIIARTPWIYPYRETLLESLDEVNYRCPSINVWIRPDKPLLETLIHARQLESTRWSSLNMSDENGETHPNIDPVIKIPHSFLPY